MTIRFFILQTHYRSTLDFSNEALFAAEKGLKRLMDAYEWLQRSDDRWRMTDDGRKNADEGRQMIDDRRENTGDGGRITDYSMETADQKVLRLLNEFEEFINDDFGTARVLANMFEIVPVINSIKDKNISADVLSRGTFQLLQRKMKTYVEDILGLKSETGAEAKKINGVMEVLIDLRKEARSRKDWVSSDKIRNQLSELGIILKDEKDGNMTWNVA
jgi:cysteinyl-tRNA synthetase